MALQSTTVIRRDQPVGLGRSSARPFSPLYNSVVISLLAVVVFVQFSATQHELVTQHAVCPQHGELIDVDNPASQPATVGADASGLSAEAGTEQQTHHQHCMFVASRNRRNAFVLARVALIHFEQVSHCAPLLLTETVHSSVALYRSAPKHSPPTA